MARPTKTRVMSKTTKNGNAHRDRRKKNGRADKGRVTTPQRRNAARKTKVVTYIGTHLVIDPDICHGQLTFKGTRVPVQTILDLLGEGYSMNFLARNYPEVPRAAMREALQLAAQVMSAHYGAEPHRFA